MTNPSSLVVYMMALAEKGLLNQSAEPRAITNHKEIIKREKVKKSKRRF